MSLFLLDLQFGSRVVLTCGYSNKFEARSWIYQEAGSPHALVRYTALCSSDFTWGQISFTLTNLPPDAHFAA